jgi:hypothetical protein
MLEIPLAIRLREPRKTCIKALDLFPEVGGGFAHWETSNQGSIPLTMWAKVKLLIGFSFFDLESLQTCRSRSRLQGEIRLTR